MIVSWFEAFYDVLDEVKRDILRSKIQKAYGPKLEKAADAILEAAQEKKKAHADRHEIKRKLREKLREIMS